MRAPRVVLVSLAGALLAAGCRGDGSPPAEPTATPTATPDPAARAAFEPADCKFEVPAGRRVECGFLTVPEDRSQPAGRTIRLHVAVFQTRDNDPAPDPVVYLGGGPGEHSLEVVAREFDDYYAPFLGNRDLIVLDQRGTGYSEPALDCPELTDRQYQALEQDLSGDDYATLLVEGVRLCHDRLVAEGVNLPAYTSRENAADLEDLRRALGHEQWNLYSVSYGTKLALTAMRDFPAGIRSVVLDSAFPLQADLFSELPANAAAAFRAFFDNCATNPACNTLFPGLEAVFYELVAKLNADPVRVPAINPLTGEEVATFFIRGDDMTGLLFWSLRTTTLISALPAFIVAANAGALEGIRVMVQPIVREAETVSDGMFLSVHCGEEAPFTSEERIAAAFEANPDLGGLFDDDPMIAQVLSVCDIWGRGTPLPVENEPVRSDIPTLVLAGQFDPTTPPAWGRLVAQDLSRSFYYELPRVGHAVIFARACPYTIAIDFLDEPTVAPDTSCIADMASAPFE